MDFLETMLLPKNDTNCIGNFINHLADDQETNLGEVSKKKKRATCRKNALRMDSYVLWV